MKEIKVIEFQNFQNPNANFDIINLEELYTRKNINHSIEHHHRVQFYLLLFIESGKGLHTVDFKDYHCNKGTIITIRKDQVHKFFSTHNITGKILLFTDDFLISYLEEIELQKTTLLFNELLGNPKLQLSNNDFNNIYGCIHRIQNEYFVINDRHSLGIIRSELHILITLLYRIKSTSANINLDKKYLKEFVLLQSLVEQKVSTTTKVKDYAALLGKSTKTLNSITKSIINKSAKEFVDEICTKQIKRLLMNSQLSIKEIAYKSGFEESSNFYKYFKRQTGYTPEQFRVLSI